MTTRIVLIILIVISQDLYSESFEKDLVSAAIERTNHEIIYDGSYRYIQYPGGDIPLNAGVCTDVIIRAYRSIGTDLQQLVHEDMVVNFDKYPSKKIWGLTRPDTNIDHRRVPNLQVYFQRNGIELPIKTSNQDYIPGDIVTWQLPGNLKHIGIVTDRISLQSGDPLIIHNIGEGPKLEDILFNYVITGHYRYVPEKYNNRIQPTAEGGG